jgi:hypothetical protein
MKDPTRHRTIIATVEGGHRPSDTCRRDAHGELRCGSDVPGQQKSHKRWRTPTKRFLDQRGVSFHDLSVDFYLREDGTVFLEVNVPTDQVIVEHEEARR